MVQFPTVPNNVYKNEKKMTPPPPQKKCIFETKIYMDLFWFSYIYIAFKFIITSRLINFYGVGGGVPKNIYIFRGAEVVSKTYFWYLYLHVYYLYYMAFLPFNY